MDAEERLAELLAQRGDLDGLRARADAGGWVETDDPAYLGGNWCAARQLADLLAQHGDLDELRFRAGAGDKEAEKRLTDLLNKQGQGEEAQQLRRFGLNPDGSIACA